MKLHAHSRTPFNAISFSIVMCLSAAYASAQEGGWQFATDTQRVIGSADALVAQSPLIALRCVAVGTPPATVASQASVVTRDVPAGSIGILVAPGLVSSLAPGPAGPVELTFAVDGQPVYSANLAVAPPENAYFGSLPGNHPAVTALQSGSVLAISAVGGSGSIRIGLGGSRIAIGNLLTFCGLTEQPPASTTPPEQMIGRSGADPFPVPPDASNPAAVERFAAAATGSDRVIEGTNLRDAMRDLVRDYRHAQDDAYLRNDEAALDVLYASDIAVIERVFLEARGRPLEPRERIAFETLRSETRYGRQVSLSPFEAQRAIQAIRLIPPKAMPPQPVPLRVYCELRLAPYEFAAAAFPISAHNCNDEILGVPRPADMQAWPAFPGRISLAPQAAEAFAKITADSLSLIVSYETDMVINVRKSESTSVVSASFSPRNNILLYAPASLTEVLLRLDTPMPVPDEPESTRSEPVGGQDVPTASSQTITLPAGTVWDLEAPAFRQQLLVTAGVVKSLPLKTRATVPGVENRLGIIQPRHNFRIEQSGSSAGIGRLFFAYGNEEYIPETATALGVPVENLVSLQMMQDNEPAVALVGLLPAAAQAYSREAPADRYGRSVIGYSVRVAVTGIDAYDTAFGKPILVLSLVPLDGRFVDSSGTGNDTLETFDLTAVEAAPEHELLDIPDRAAIVLRAVEGLPDQDPRKVIGDLMEWPDQLSAFDRQGVIEDMIERAAQVQAPTDTVWTVGSISFDQYDFTRELFPARSVTLGTLEGLVTPELPVNALVFNLEPPGLLDLRMDRAAAQRWQETHPSRTFTLRAHLQGKEGKLEYGRLRLEASLIAAELLSTPASVRLRDPAQVLYRYDPFAAPVAAPVISEPTPTPAVPVPVADVAVSRDILGIRLGESVETAIERLTVELGATEEYHSTAQLRSEWEPRPQWQSYSTATLLYAPDQAMTVALYSEPPASGGTVTAVVRSQGFPLGEGPHPKMIFDQLVTKYGPASEKTMIWMDVRTADGDGPVATDQALAQCQRILGASYAQAGVLANVERRRGSSNSGAAPRWFTKSGEVWTPPDVGSLNIEGIFRPLADCPRMGEITFALFDMEPDGLIAGLHVVIANPAEVGRRAAENEQAVIDGSDAARPSLPIKF